MADKKIRLVVEMYGGTIQGVHTDSDVECDVVFLEDSKYGTSESDEPEFAVEAGAFKDQIIYCHHDSLVASPENIEAVFLAADKRLEEGA